MHRIISIIPGILFAKMYGTAFETVAAYEKNSHGKAHGEH
jgi:hypothetical protein